ncbi:hypothetical protein JZ751_011712 [Albula glossodonta]|uniref:Uncharacterized protein n=1 Tax=Albula glossodonta TaxID=121402 RepID=A0A8T2PQD7_9TELE|nr:hypothetical protein JZ751_011712 [Albula glossodonta]
MEPETQRLRPLHQRGPKKGLVPAVYRGGQPGGFLAAEVGSSSLNAALRGEAVKVSRETDRKPC